MMLPDIDELDLKQEKKSETRGKETPKRKNQSNEKQDKVEHLKKESGKRKLIIPKSEYDENGNPILMIPDLNDVDLNKEISRFFGKREG